MDEEYSAEFTLTDESKPDCEGDRVRVAGTDLSPYYHNPVVLLGHDSRVPVGSSRNPKTGKLDIVINQLRGTIVGTCHFHLLTRESRETAELVKRGFLKGASLGFHVLAEKRRHPRGRDILRCRVFEWSIVGVPCNEGALRRELPELSPKVAKLIGASCGCGKCGERSETAALMEKNARLMHDLKTKLGLECQCSACLATALTAVADLAGEVRDRQRIISDLAKAVVGPREFAAMAAARR